MRVERIGVVGAGTMGAGIAQLAGLAGCPTRVHDRDAEALEAGRTRMAESLAKGVERGRWGAAEAEEAGRLVKATTDLADLAGSDMVIEAAPEDLKLKRDLFASLSELCAPEAVLATNTSSLPVAEIALDALYTERVVGMHFFNPPPLMELVEIVATPDSSGEALEAAGEVAERMGRTPIRAKDSPGFIANRLARPLSLEALRMLSEEVAGAETIDRACRLGGGFRMGPFELLDLIGLDINLSVARSLYAQGGKPERWRPSPIQEAMVSDGLLGRKSGQGFYSYPEEGEPHREPDPNLGIAAPTLDPSELARIDPAAPEIVPRLVAQIANEAAFALEEEAGSPEDMDTAMRLGFNWPLGPLELAELMGGERALKLLEELRRARGEAYAPAPRLAEIAAGKGAT